VASIVVLATTRHLPSSGRFWPTCHLDPVSGSLKDSNGEVTVISLPVAILGAWAKSILRIELPNLKRHATSLQVRVIGIC
jgi:hypothetical protein